MDSPYYLKELFWWKKKLQTNASLTALRVDREQGLKGFVYVNRKKWFHLLFRNTWTKNVNARGLFSTPCVNILCFYRLLSFVFWNNIVRQHFSCNIFCHQSLFVVFTCSSSRTMLTYAHQFIRFALTFLPSSLRKSPRAGCSDSIPVSG